MNAYFTKFQTIIGYDLIFWGEESESSTVLKISKRILHLMNGVNSRTSCRHTFKKLKLLLPPYKFLKCCAIFANIIYSLLQILIYTKERLFQFA
jgi:hypothetical protein